MPRNGFDLIEANNERLKIKEAQYQFRNADQESNTNDYYQGYANGKHTVKKADGSTYKVDAVNNGGIQSGAKVAKDGGIIDQQNTKNTPATPINNLISTIYQIKYIYSVIEKGKTNFYVGGYQKKPDKLFTLNDDEEIFTININNLGKKDYTVDVMLFDEVDYYIRQYKNGKKVYEIKSVRNVEEVSLNGDGSYIYRGHGFWVMNYQVAGDNSDESSFSTLDLYQIYKGYQSKEGSYTVTTTRTNPSPGVSTVTKNDILKEIIIPNKVVDVIIDNLFTSQNIPTQSYQTNIFNEAYLIASGPIVSKISNKGDKAIGVYAKTVIDSSIIDNEQVLDFTERTYCYWLYDKNAVQFTRYKCGDVPPDGFYGIINGFLTLTDKFFYSLPNDGSLVDLIDEAVMNNKPEILASVKQYNYEFELEKELEAKAFVPHVKENYTIRNLSYHP